MSRAAQPQRVPEQPAKNPAPEGVNQGAAASPDSTAGAPGPAAAQQPGIQRRFQPRQEGPRRVRDGLKLSTREGPVARTPMAERWLSLIDAHVPAELMAAGLDYARSGQVVSLQVMPGEVESHVQGSVARPYLACIAVPAFDEAQWQQVVEAMAVEAIHHAKLLSGELPPALDRTFAELQMPLLPAPDSVTISCTCSTGKSGAACKHVAAVAAMFADQLSNNPLLIFALLGLPAERLIERLRQARVIHTHGVASAHGEADIPGSQVAALPLESTIDDFWHGAGDLEQIEWQPPASAVPHALLRRLGPSPMRGRFPMVGLLASIYDAVAEEARKR
jgi:uncharacterized Zn finger protein